MFDYDTQSIDEYNFDRVQDCFHFHQGNRITWINVDGLRKADVEAICNHYQVHPLLIEDILSIGQRPKMDEVEGVLFCLLNMLYFNDRQGTVEQEQISIQHRPQPSPASDQRCQPLRFEKPEPE